MLTSARMLPSTHPVLLWKPLAASAVSFVFLYTPLILLTNALDFQVAVPQEYKDGVSGVKVHQTTSICRFYL